MEKRKLVVVVLKIIILLGVVFGGYVFFKEILNPQTIKIANWNLEIFGEKKAYNNDLMNFYVKKISDYDIIFIQEIRDQSQEAFPKLCSMLQNYTCLSSSRAGTTSMKEQYGIIYKDNINLIYFRDYNPQEKNKFERPPIEIVFKIEDYTLKVYNIHIKPDNVKQELINLENLISDYGNVIIIGDLNADCSYYEPRKETEFDDWNWIVKDKDDTTVGETDCAYDRIILNNDAEKEYRGYGIEKDISSEASDHYLIWAKLKIN